LAQHKSAKKRARQTEKRRARNRHITSGLKTAVKAVRSASGDDAATALRAAESTIRKAATKGVLSKKQASRRISRLTKGLNRATA
jgi:small subunit ribosomal protein S20